MKKVVSIVVETSIDPLKILNGVRSFLGSEYGIAESDVDFHTRSKRKEANSWK